MAIYSIREDFFMIVEGGYGREGVVREFGIDMYTLLYLKWKSNKNQLYMTGNFAQCCVSTWIIGEFGGEGILVHI